MHRISFAPELSATFSRVSCWIIHYRAFSTISSTRQRFSLEIGRVSVMRTRSPTPHSFLGSWTLKRARCWTVLRYRRWAFEEPTWTMTVLSILSLITVPRRTLRRPGVSVSVEVVGVAVAVSLTQPPPSWRARGALVSALLQPLRLAEQPQPRRPLPRPPPQSLGRRAPRPRGRSRSRAREARS